MTRTWETVTGLSLGRRPWRGSCCAQSWGEGGAGSGQESACGFNSIDASNPESALKIGELFKTLTPPHVCSSWSSFASVPPGYQKRCYLGEPIMGGTPGETGGRWRQAGRGQNNTKKPRPAASGSLSPLREAGGPACGPVLCTPSHQCLPSSDRIRIGNNTSSHVR